MSESFSSSSSYSSPVVPQQETITQNILNSIAGVATNYANQLYNWGQGVFNGLSGDISGIMGKLDTAANTAMTGANQAMGAFTSGFLPDYNALRTEAGQYASPARQARNAGMAESTQMQANQQALNDVTQKLESMGINTSAGRYAHDLTAGKTAGAAAAAGAGTQSIRADEQTALGLKKNALDYGIQFPGIAANFINQANQARSVAGNLDIGRTNAGTALMQVPNVYLNTAMQDRYPPIGNIASHTATQQSSSPGPASRSPGSPGSPGGFQNTNTPGSWTGMGTGPGGTSDAGFTSGYGGGGAGPGYLYPGGYGTGTTEVQPPGGGDISYAQQTDQFGNPWQVGSDQMTGPNDVAITDYGTYAQPSPTDNNPNMMYDPSWSQGFNDASYTPAPDTSGGGSYYDTSATYSDPGTSDYSAGFATGGAIPDGPTQGGFVPPSASPSDGQQTDDIHASLNANEFVIPRDVSLWKGQEFFQKLIAQSRKNLAQAQAQGKPAPAPQGPVRFASRPTGA